MISNMRMNQKFRENELVNNFVVFEFENEPKFRENKLVKNFDFFEHDDEPKIPRK